tara:strand:- start:166 stop:375 length:210 start_codon:yes stop_codon:yes gene_type:complete
MTQEEFVDNLILKAKTKCLKRDLQIISDNLFEQIDHTILTHMMCLIVEYEHEIINNQTFLDYIEVSKGE